VAFLDERFVRRLRLGMACCIPCHTLYTRGHMVDTTSILSIRIPNTLRARIEARAASERRKVSALAVLLLEDAMEAEGRPTPRLPVVKAAPLPIGLPEDVALLQVLDTALAEVGYDITSLDGVAKRVVKLAIVRSAFADAQPQYAARTNRAHFQHAMIALEQAGVVGADAKFVWRI
jgi:hypothetical protein